MEEWNIKISEELLERRRIGGEGYSVLVSYDKWRVAAAGFAAHLTPQKLPHFEKHLMTDEVFILMQSKAFLFTAGNGIEPGKVEVYALRMGEVCNVKCGIWHAIAMEPDCQVIIVENDDTSSENTIRIPITDQQREQVMKLVRGVMG